MPLDLPAGFTLGYYHFTLEALEPLHLSPFKGSALRGGFGLTFKRMACARPQVCGERCELGNACAYGYIFETRPPDDSQVLRSLDEIPRPFIIEPPEDRSTLVPAGAQLTFGVTLIGQGMRYLPDFVHVFRRLGQIGLGNERGKYSLLAVEALSPRDGTMEAIYREGEDEPRPLDATVDAKLIAGYAAALPADRITLDFLTPTRLKHEGHWVHQGPPFHVLVRTLLARVSSLSYFHCGERWEVDFRGLIDRAEEVRVARSETHWEDWSRFSGRQQQRVEMGGVAGRITYAGDLRDYLPLLAMGELVHVGKGTVTGNGKYVISQT
jgi:hypothetical protein